MDSNQDKMTGSFMDGVSALAHEVVVSIDSLREELVITSAVNAEEMARWKWSEAIVDSQHGGDSFHVYTGIREVEVLTSSSAVLLEELRWAGCDHKGVAGGQSPKRFVAAVSCAIILLVTGIYLTLPSISRGVAEVVPLEYEQKIGLNIQALLKSTYCDAPEATALLAKYADKLGPERAGKWEVHISKAGAPNAFALPGGVIVFTDGAIRSSESIHEILGVLAHEIEHVERRHVLASVVRSTILTSLWAMTIGDYAGLMVVDPSTAYEIANLKFSRDVEQEADIGAIKRLLHNDLPTDGIGTFLERISHDHDDSLEWLSSHPSAVTRVDYISEMTERLKPTIELNGDAFDSDVLAAEWEILQTSCLSEEAEETEETEEPIEE